MESDKICSREKSCLVWWQGYFSRKDETVKGRQCYRRALRSRLRIALHRSEEFTNDKGRKQVVSSKALIEEGYCGDICLNSCR